MPNRSSRGQSPTQVTSRFLQLLDDVCRIPERFQEEITTLRAHIDTLQEANQTLTASLLPDILGCAIYLVSGEGNIQAWSGGASDIYGYSAEEALGRPLAFLQARPDPCTAGVPAGAPPRRPVRRRKDGSTFEVLLHHAILRDEHGGPTGHLIIEIPCGSGRETADVRRNGL